MEESKESTFALILAAAGKSTRFSRKGSGSSDPAAKKTFTHLGGKPIWLRSVEKFTSRDDVIQTIIVVAPEDVGWFRQYYASEINRMLLLVVAGGENRVDSIRRGLIAVSLKADYVAVHDAARPCVTEQEIADVFEEAKKRGAALLAAPVVGTVKKVAGGRVEATVPREHLWEAQTPQVFRRELLIEAYQQRIERDIPTDDAQLVERLGQPVYIVPADRGNIKITTQSDLILAKYMIEKGR
jgi:2-C-methyl-D-erythritol 4-phosphate cytidylyltransferase